MHVVEVEFDLLWGVLGSSSEIHCELLSIHKS